MDILAKILKDENITLCPNDGSGSHPSTEHINKICGLDGHEGYAFCVKGRKYIYTGAQVTGWEMKYVIAHELGHILMGHLDPDFKECDRQTKESNADVFAAVFTALLLFHEYR